MYTLFSTKSPTRTFYKIEGESKERLPDYPSYGGLYQMRLEKSGGSYDELKKLEEDARGYLKSIELELKAAELRLDALKREGGIIDRILSELLVAQENLRQQQQQSLDRETQKVNTALSILGVFHSALQGFMRSWSR